MKQIATRAISLTALATASTAMLSIGAIDGHAGSKIPLPIRLQSLLQGYPNAIVGIEGNKLLLKDGSRITIDDGRAKSHSDKLKTADIEDMLSQIYPLGSCAQVRPARNFDPGRIRNDRFFRAVYGNSRAAASSHLATVNWFGKRLRFTTIGGADKALRLVRDDLLKLNRKYRKFFSKTAGTFNWRKIAGTHRLSVHSFGAAIDINVKYADYWRWSGGRPGKVPRYHNKIPKPVVEAFERHGFIWGGKWYHYDTMHFEYRPALIAIGKLSAARNCAR